MKKDCIQAKHQELQELNLVVLIEIFKCLVPMKVQG